MPSASNLPPRICAVCGAEFSPKHARAKYCRKQCLWKSKNAANYARNPEKCRAQARKYNAIHSEKRKQYHRDKYARNRAMYRAKMDAFYAETRKNTPWALLVQSAKARAKKNNLAFDLTNDWGAKKWTGKCALSDLPFKLDVTATEPRMYSPTIDRIEPSKGYIQSNCRFVLWAVNIFKNSGTDEEMFTIASAILKKREQQSQSQ